MLNAWLKLSGLVLEREARMGRGSLSLLAAGKDSGVEVKS